ERWAQCYSGSVEGPGESDGLCIEVTGSGELLWRFDPIPCEHEGLFFPQQVLLRGDAPVQLRGRLVSYLDAQALIALSPGTGEFSPEMVQPLDATLLKLAADQPVQMAVNLWAGDRRVAWSADETTLLEVEVLSGEAP